MYDDLTAQEQKEALKALLDSKGWSILQSVLQEQIKLRTDEMILKPTCLIDGGYTALEFMKGEIAGIRTVLFTASAMLENASQEVEENLEKEKEDDDSDLDADDSDFEPPSWTS